MPGATVPAPAPTVPKHVPPALAWSLLGVVSIAAIGAVVYVSFVPSEEAPVVEVQVVTPAPQAPAENPLDGAESDPVNTVKLNPFD